MADTKPIASTGSIELKNRSYSDDGPVTTDDADLNRLGKKDVLRRDFGFVSMVGLACTVMATWEGNLVTFGIGFFNGGYTGVFWGFILVWLGNLAAFTTMAEMSSMAPTAGGQYHWTAMLAPRSTGRFLSYIVGWIATLSWMAFTASGFYLCATILQGLISMANPTFVSSEWQVPLFYWVFTIVAVLFNTVISKALPKVETVTLMIHIFGFIAIMVPLVVYGTTVDANTVFNTWSNGGMWPNQGTSFLVGLLGPCYSFLGADSAIHMSENIKSPATNVPKAMIFSIFLNGLLGIGMIVAVLFVLSDPDDVLVEPTGFPFMNVFLQAIPNLAGAITMATLVFILTICAAISFLAATSRLTWALARDRGFPGWQYISKINAKTNIPIVAIVLTVTVVIILSLIAFGSSVAFNDVISLSVAGLYSSYLTGNFLILWRRLKGDIKPYNSFNSNEIVNVGPERLAWGPWKVREPFGTIINIIGCLYLVLMIVFMYFPGGIQPTPAEMNWSIFMVGVVAAFAVVYYMVAGKRTYTGPVIEI